jgi:undecaprenyl-diphosphatase
LRVVILFFYQFLQYWALLGTVIAAIVGYIALKILLRMVKQGHLYYFAPYCWLLGAATLIFSLST